MRPHLAILVLALVTLTADGAHAFSILHSFLGTPQTRLPSAARWAPEFGLSDGIQVGVAPGFATSLGAQSAAEIQLVRDAVLGAFGAWENPALQFDIAFDAQTTIDNTSGFEIDLMALAITSPVFSPNPTIFGMASIDRTFGGLRTLTNGVEANGFTILGADIYLNADLILAVVDIYPTQQEQLDALTRLMMHEIGHSIGLGHPTTSLGFPFYDTDLDPTNAIQVDPNDPFAGFIFSPNVDPTAIMATRPCGPASIECPAIFFTELQPDDRAGRDVLYPSLVPEPGLSWSVMCALVALYASRRQRQPTLST